MKIDITGMLIVILFILLASCTHITTPDGPPNFYVDASKIPNAVPKVEPLAKYGNMPSYTVFGKRYYTLRNAKGFEQIGIASWYGTKFNAHRTSSGEPYSMLAMTAAHKTLPLPSYVEVTNLKNRRRIIVKVNDRGPFSQNRIIDLSYVAAKKLGMIGHGTAPVKIRVIDPGSRRPILYARHTAPRPIPRPVQIAQKRSRLYLRVGAFRNRSNAFRLKDRLVAILKAPVDVTIPGINSSFYKVRIGPIEDMATADSLTARLQALGFKPLSEH